MSKVDPADRDSIRKTALLEAADICDALAEKFKGPAGMGVEIGVDSALGLLTWASCLIRSRIPEPENKA